MIRRELAGLGVGARAPLQRWPQAAGGGTAWGPVLIRMPRCSPEHQVDPNSQAFPLWERMSERQRSSWHSRRRGLCARGRRPPAPGSAPGTPNNDWPCPPGPAPPAASEACRAEGRAARHRLPGRTQPAPRLNTRRPPSMSRTPRGAPSHWRVGPRQATQTREGRARVARCWGLGELGPEGHGSP